MMAKKYIFSSLWSCVTVTMTTSDCSMWVHVDMLWALRVMGPWTVGPWTNLPAAGVFSTNWRLGTLHNNDSEYLQPFRIHAGFPS